MVTLLTSVLARSGSLFIDCEPPSFHRLHPSHPPHPQYPHVNAVKPRVLFAWDYSGASYCIFPAIRMASNSPSQWEIDNMPTQMDDPPLPDVSNSLSEWDLLHMPTQTGEPPLPDIVATHGAHLLTRPSTPVWVWSRCPRRFYDDLVETLLLLQDKEHLRPCLYGEHADDSRVGHTPPETRA